MADGWDEAVAEARSIVVSFFGSAGDDARSADELYAAYVGFGENPFIVYEGTGTPTASGGTTTASGGTPTASGGTPTASGGTHDFSAWAYARQICDEIEARRKQSNRGQPE